MTLFSVAVTVRGVGLCVLALLLSACGRAPAPADSAGSAPPAAETPPRAAEQRPMDEVPRQESTAEGERLYRFANGCVVVIQPKQAVVKREGPQCASHHRDIALLYASGD